MLPSNVAAPLGSMVHIAYSDLALLHHLLHLPRFSPPAFVYICLWPSSEFAGDAVDCFTQATGMIFLYIVVWQVGCAEDIILQRCPICGTPLNMNSSLKIA